MRMKAFIACLALLFAGYAAAAIYVKTQRQEGFDHVKIGDAYATVEDAIGPPDAVKDQGTPFPRYETSGCAQPCVKRFWYENRLLFDVEAWSIDIGRDGNVTDKYHWVSP
jgi:hypothetical protein